MCNEKVGGRMSDKTSDKNKQAIKTSDRLLSCPFCGGEAGIDSDKIGKGKSLYYAYCKNDCITQYGYYSSKESAITAWNTRKPMERILERLEQESVLAEKEMDRAREQNPLQYERCDSYICAIDNAIEIVKEEGVIE